MSEIAIEKLHHAAYRCRNSEETRAFYEDFLGLPLVGALEIGTTASGRDASVLHTFFQMANGACIAFFEEPDEPFDFKDQRDFDLHIALQVDAETLVRMLARAKEEGYEVRGPIDHDFIHSIYFRDPNGYVVELTTPVGEPLSPAPDRRREARATLDAWSAGGDAASA